MRSTRKDRNVFLGKIPFTEAVQSEQGFAYVTVTLQNEECAELEEGRFSVLA